MGDNLRYCSPTGVCNKSIQIPSHGLLCLQDQGQFWGRKTRNGDWILVTCVMIFLLKSFFFFFWWRNTSFSGDADGICIVSIPLSWSSPCSGPRVLETVKATENRASCGHTLGTNPIATFMGGEGY